MEAITLVHLPQDALHHIFQYQHGICEDMRPFLALPDFSDVGERAGTPDYRFIKTDPIILLQELAKKMDILLAPWLATYSVNRVGRLLNCINTAREPVLVWAAYMGRLDVLTEMNHRVDLHTCSDKLLIAGARHSSVLAYLHTIGYQAKIVEAVREAATYGHATSVVFLLAYFPVPSDWLDNTTVTGMAYWGHRSTLELVLATLVGDPDLLRMASLTSAAANHLDTANWLHGVLTMDLHLRLDSYYRDFFVSLAASRGHLDGLEWLLQAFTVENADALAHLEVVSLREATRHGHRQVAHWVVPRIEQSAINEIFIRDDRLGSILHGAVDATVEITGDDLVAHVFEWSVEKIQQVFTTFANLARPGHARTDALWKCLGRVISLGRLETLSWFVGCLSREDVEYIARQSLPQGMHKGGVPLLEYFETLDIHLTMEEMDSELFSSLRQHSTKSSLPWWLQDAPDLDEYDSLKETLTRWLVTRRGGRVAVLGRMLVRLAQVKKSLVQFQTLFYEWMAFVGDDDEKKRVLMACLDQRKPVDNMDVLKFLVTVEPRLFAIVSTLRPLSTVQTLHQAVAKRRPADELSRLEVEAMNKAGEAGRDDIVMYLAHQTKDYKATTNSGIL
ncbi:Aste57867_12648 [Aphanomyces stellatus]|uniref:Aste57867_12648 protein n=1 Tax=Aphanomyces stellatus TaxID=120398 RepID=A0A485KWX5_9STRA|nr:hypothetical protein As57867_012602 [Aphanomyces stellatus]VFT89498.1 Aste57867_12648 [Aphanomyces stellatus]